VINDNSRYAQSKLVILTEPDFPGGDRLTIVAGQQAAFTVSYTWYQVKQGQRIDQIALAYYGDGTLWWKIADANPAIMDWSVLPLGTLLRIPNA
jgi:nucleoid-associated protein YgaU